MKDIRINKDKSIGSVIYIVEGDNTEPSILTHIFNKLLGYTIVSYNKNKNEFVELEGTNRYSRVYIVPSKYSAVRKLDESESYFDDIYFQLALDYGLDVSNSAIFFIFDRDRESNRPTVIKKYFSKYSNSRDNGTEMNGLFLLSYPSIESFIINSNAGTESLESAKQAKEIVDEEEYKIDGITAEMVLKATDYLITCMGDISGFVLENLDNFSDKNHQMFDYQESKWNKEGVYLALSMLSISLVDLGVIELPC